MPKDSGWPSSNSAKNGGAGLADWMIPELWDFGGSFFGAGGEALEVAPSVPTASQTVDSSDGMVVALGGEATAVGTDTLAQGDVFSQMIDTGPITAAFGFAKFTATAQSAKGDTTFATTDAFFEASGADFVMTFETTSGGSRTRGGQTIASETTSLMFLAVDIENWESATGPVMIEAHSASQLGWAAWGMLGWAGWMGVARHPRTWPQVEGNTAILEVDAQAQGADTLVVVESSVLTVEDELSTVSALAVIGIG